MLDIRANHSIADLIPGTAAYSQYKTLADSVGSTFAKDTSFNASIKRLNALDLNLTKDSLIPSRSLFEDPVDSAAKIADQANQLKSRVTTVLSNLPSQGQRDTILLKTGLGSNPFLQTMALPRQQPGQQGQPGQKVATRAQVHQYAVDNGTDDNTAQSAFQQKGYTIQ